MTIEVVQDPQAEVEMDPPSEPGNLWPLRAPNWLPTRELFWPLFWGYQEGEEGATSLRDVAPGEVEEEEKDYAAEDGEDQQGTQDEDEELRSSGATDSWDYGWPGPQNWDFKEADSYGEWSALAYQMLPYSVLRGKKSEGKEESLQGKES